MPNFKKHTGYQQKPKQKAYAKKVKIKKAPPSITDIKAKRDKRMLETIKVDAAHSQELREMAADPIMFRSANVSRKNYTGPKVVQPPVAYEKEQAKKEFFRKQRAKLKDFSQVYNKPNAKPKMLKNKRKNYA